VDFTVVDAPPIGGVLRYDRGGLAFDFRPAEPAVAARAAGAVELAFGSMTVRIDRGSAEVRSATGYHPNAGWLAGSLGSPTAVPNRLRVALPRMPARGVALRLARVDELTTIRDERTGWIRIGRTGVTTGTQFVEFATGCLAELASGDLVALWLHPETT
jgi:hypothetical protein